MANKTVTAKMIQFIIDRHNEGKSWETVAAEVSKEFKEKKTAEAVRSLYRYYANFYESTDGEVKVKSLQAITRLRKTNSVTARENRAILEHLDEQSDVIEEISAVIKKMKGVKIPAARKSVRSGKTKMIMEVMLSDIHYGLRTSTYSTAIARQRIAKMAQVCIDEYHRHSVNYNVVGFVYLVNGDIIQSATMHPDSGNSCDSTNPEQVANAVESLFMDFIVPMSQLGVPTRVIATPGNHDRYESSRITANPGRGYLTHAIYRSLELLCKQTKIKNITWTIPDEGFVVYDIFGRWFLVEHGDMVKGPTPIALENQISRRSAQTDKNIIGIRIGHFHSPSAIDLGRFVINGTVSSDDHYATGLGFKSITAQAINFYCETNNRRTPYYYTFFVNLED